MKLSAEVVLELAQVKTKLAALKTRETDLVEAIKSEMRNSKEFRFEFAPKDCPYKLVRSEHERSSVKWKDEWQYLAKKWFGKKKWQQEEKKLIEDSKDPVETLNLEPNAKGK